MREPQHADSNRHAARPWEPWRDDHLGRELRDGLSPLRAAQPSDEAWARVAARIAADEPLIDRLPHGLGRALAIVLGSGTLQLRARDVRVRATGLLAAAAMVAISIASFGVIRGGTRSAATFSDMLYAPQPLAGLTAHEVAIQPAINPRPVARALPGGAVAESILRSLRGVRSQRAQELLDRSERTFGLPRHCLEIYEDRSGRPADDSACRYAPAGPQPAWVELTDPPQSL